MCSYNTERSRAELISSKICWCECTKSVSETVELDTTDAQNWQHLYHNHFIFQTVLCWKQQKIHVEARQSCPRNFFTVSASFWATAFWGLCIKRALCPSSLNIDAKLLQLKLSHGTYVEHMLFHIPSNVETQRP